MNRTDFIARINATISALDLSDGMRVEFDDYRAERFDDCSVSFVAAPDSGLTDEQFDAAQTALIEAVGREHTYSDATGEYLDGRHGLTSGYYLAWDLDGLDD